MTDEYIRLHRIAIQDLGVDEFQSQGEVILDICKYSLALDAGTVG